MDVVKNIIEIRKEKGKNQEILADALNVDVSAISNIEKGKRELKVSELGKIANALDVDILYLFTYPDIYFKPNDFDKSKSPKVTLQIDIDQDDIKAEVIKLAFGDRIVEIKNK